MYLTFCSDYKQLYGIRIGSTWFVTYMSVVEMDGVCYLNTVKDPNAKTWKLGTNIFKYYNMEFDSELRLIDVKGLSTSISDYLI